MNIVMDRFHRCHILRGRIITERVFAKTGICESREAFDGKKLICSSLTRIKSVCEDAISSAPSAGLGPIRKPSIAACEVPLTVILALEAV